MTEARRRVTGTLFLAGLLITVAGGCDHEALTLEDPLKVPRPAKIITVTDEGSRTVRTFPGRVRAAQAVDLAFRVGGPLVDLPVTEGQRVSRDQLIARIDPRDYRVRTRGLEAQLAAAEAQLNGAQLQFERVSTLYANKSMAKAAFDEARAARDVSSAQVESTAEALRAARLALEDTELRAPYDGIVAEKLVETHHNVRPGEAIVHFQDTSRLEILIHLSERDMATLTTHEQHRLSATFGALPCPSENLRVGEYETEPDPQTQTFLVTLVLEPEACRGVLPGMSASVAWQPAGGARAGTVTVPLESVFTDEAGAPHVWRVDPESETVERVKITPGALGENGLELLSGLTPGERILAAGVHFVTDGQRVRPMASRPGG